ncbi:MAG TPA: agmatine deiminase family protein [Planctomycetota bacterium]|nr:agmatine deiminase family protein [Planctomycetota bacterium]
MDRQQTLDSPGHRMPAEWEPHEATWLAWPHKRESWPGIFDRIPRVWAAMVRALRGSEEVRILTRDAAMDAEVRLALEGDLAGVRTFHIPTNDAWIRDYGPIFAHRSREPGKPVLVSWRYNSWGGKYGPWDLDDAVPGKLGAVLGLPVVETGMVLEGGSIDVDGEGTLLTTRSCLLNPNRNPSLNAVEIEERLRRWLGAERVLWLGDGIVGDDTDGHVDDLTRFVAPGRVVTAVEREERDPNYLPLHENREMLRGMTDAAGRKLEVIDLPMPPPIFHEGHRCPASYANFLIANRSVLVPTFRSERDALAIGILREVFPGREVTGIDCSDMVWGLGAVHCVTQQQPAPLQGLSPVSGRDRARGAPRQTGGCRPSPSIPRGASRNHPPGRTAPGGTARH